MVNKSQSLPCYSSLLILAFLLIVGTSASSLSENYKHKLKKVDTFEQIYVKSSPPSSVDEFTKEIHL